MSGLYSDLPATGDGSGDTGSWIKRQGPQMRPPPKTRPKAAAAAVTGGGGGFNPLSGYASQSPLLGAGAGRGSGGAARSEVQTLEQRLAAASAKLAAQTKSVLGSAAAAGAKATAAAAGGKGGGKPADGSGGSGGADVFPAVADEYDPRKPNDYADYCQRRLARKKREMAQRDLELQMRKLEEERKRAKAEDAQKGYASLRSAVDQARAGAGSSGRGRGRALTVPAWMAKAGPGGAAAGTKPGTKPPPPSFNAVPGQFDDADGGTKPGAPSSSGPGFGGASLDKAARMMNRMGYQSGRGLGAREDGIASALVHKPTGRGMGQLVAPPPPSFGGGRGAGRGMAPPPAGGGGNGSSSSSGAGAGAPPPAKRVKAGLKNLSPVVLLRNMVDPGGVDDRLEGEVKGECAKFGGVAKVMIFEVKNPEAAGCPREGAVRIFVEFQSLAGAMKAVQDLDGRYFAKRRISAVFYPKNRFQAYDLQPKPGEPALQID